MATHAQNIENLRTAVYGEQVRQSMIQLFEEDYTLVSNGISIGTAVTSASSSTTGYSDGNVYINSNTLNVYKLVSPSWTLVGNLKGIADITAIESSADGAANVVTFTLTDGTTKSFSIKNGKTGAQGVSVSNAVDNGDGTFKLQLSDGTQTSNVATIKGDRGTGIKRTIDNNDGTFKFELTDGTYTNDVATIKGDTGNTGKGVTSITATGTGKNHILSANFTDGTSNIICTVKDGADGSGVGDMLKSVYDPLDKGYVTAAEGVTDGTFTATYATIDGKADKGTSLSDYGILDAYTKSEVDAKVGTGNIIDSVSADFDIVNKELELSTSMIGRVSNLDINGKISSSKVKYDNTVSQLSSTDVKGAIDEVTNRLSTIEEDELNLKMLGYTLPDSLKGMNYIDSNNVFHQRVARVDLGSLTWTYSSSASLFFATLSDAPQRYDIDMYCKKYTQVTIWRDIISTDKAICKANNANVYIHDSAFTDATAFKLAMSGVYLYYELATEVTKNVDGHEYVTEELVWKYHTQITGGNSTVLPSSFSELLVICCLDDGTRNCNILIPKIDLGTTKKYYNAGFYASSSMSNAYCVGVTQTMLTTEWGYNNGSAVSSTMKTRVYYR